MLTLTRRRIPTCIRAYPGWKRATRALSAGGRTRELKGVEKGGARIVEGEGLGETVEVKMDPISKLVWRSITRKPTHLHITLKGSLPIMRRPRGLFSVPSSDLTLPQVLGALSRAEKDPLIESVIITVKPLSCRFAKVEELVQAIRSVRSVKKVTAYFQIGAEAEIAIATACTEAYCPPSARVSLSGFYSRYTLLSGLADTIGIEPEVFQRGLYKGGHSFAGEWQDGKGLPNEVRERSEGLRDSQRQSFISLISENLQISKEQVSEILKAGPTSAEELVGLGVVSGMIYEDEIIKALQIDKTEDSEHDTETKQEANSQHDTKSKQDITEEQIHSKSGKTDKEKAKQKPRIVTGKRYLSVPLTELGLAPKRSLFSRILRREPNPGIAIIPLVGAIQDGKGRGSGVYSEPTLEALRDVAKRKDIHALVLRIDSGGGSALASDQIWRAVSLLGKQMPVVASMGDVAASGGYYIAMGAEKIYASPTTITGSIGVITLRFSLEKLLRRLQIWTQTDGGQDPYGAMGASVHRRLTPEEHRRIDVRIESIYQDFLRKAADCRGLSVDEMVTLAEGRVFTGSEAFDNGLVDALGGLMPAVQCAAELIGRESWNECHLFPIRVGRRTLIERITGISPRAHLLEVSHTAGIPAFAGRIPGFEGLGEGLEMLESLGDSSNLKEMLGTNLAGMTGLREFLPGSLRFNEEPLAILDPAYGLPEQANLS
ncbi:hypothetical protein AAMO2058_000282500 [Amorphochlora amoebiformis]